MSPGSAAPAAEFKGSVLIVDDKPENILAVCAMLEELGQNLVTARSGAEALRHLLRDDFAVVLLDVQMPEMDGFEVAALMREREKTRHTPIIFMTAAHRSEAAVAKGYQVGGVDYIFKPVIPEILRSKVSVFVELARKTEMIRRQAELLREAERREHERKIDDALAFSRAVSHDLRAPLRHVQSFSELLLAGYQDALDEKGRDYLRRLAGAGQKMMKLIDAMLKLSEASGGELSREIVDLSRAAASVEADLRRAEPSRRVEVRIQGGLRAAGDPSLLKAAVDNLLRNAWKYTARREAARIEFARVDHDSGPAFVVRDDGVGFDPALSDRLFLPFSRLHPRGEFEGSGLGLATVQRILERHGGRIWAESRPGQGAAFYFTLPD